MTKNDFLIELAGTERTSFGKQDFAKQSFPQKVFSAVRYAEMEVCNGGFSLYFENDRKETSGFVVEAFETIGAHRTADLFTRAVAAHDGLEFDAYHTELEELDRAFYAYEDDRIGLLFAYVARHPDEFGPVPEVEEDLPRDGPLWEEAEKMSRVGRFINEVADLEKRIGHHALANEHRKILKIVGQLENMLGENEALRASTDPVDEDYVTYIRRLIHRSAAAAHAGLGGLDEAVGHATSAVKVTREHPRPDGAQIAQSENQLASYFRSAGRLDEALATLDRALAVLPGHVPSLIGKAGYLHLAGNKKESEALFASAAAPAGEIEEGSHLLLKAWYHALRGDTKAMRESLEAATQPLEGTSVAAFARSHKDFSTYRDDKAFLAWLEQLEEMSPGPAEAADWAPPMSRET